MTVDYLALRHIHIACVVLSGSGFFVRGVLMSCASPLLAQRWLRVVPHAIDTLLLGSAVLLAVQSGQYPLAQDWLTAKVLALLHLYRLRDDGAQARTHARRARRVLRRCARRLRLYRLGGDDA